jgi:hypothetical protein
MKQLTLLLLILACYCTQSIAQQWNLRLKNSIDFIIGGDLGYRFIVNKTNDQEVSDHFRFRNKAESVKSSFRIGFNYNLAVSEKVFFKTGMRLTNPGYLATWIDTTIYKKEGSPNFFNLNRDFKYSYLFLEMPIMVRYIYSENWCKSFIEGGFSTNYYLETRIKSIPNEDSAEIYNLKEEVTPINLSANVSIGAEFLIAKRIPAFIQMIFRYQITNLEKNQLKEYLWTAGFESGMRYEF